MDIILVSPTDIKNMEGFTIRNSEESRIQKSETDVEANTFVIMFTIQKRLDDKEIITLKIPFLDEEIFLNRMWLYHKRIGLERKLSTKVLTFEEVVHLLKKVCVTDKENLMISYNGDGVDDRKSTYDGCVPLVNMILS